MTAQDQLEIVKHHYALQAAGDHDAAEQFLTDDFVIEIPSYMPFAGVYRGRGAFRELIPIVVASAGVKDLRCVATTVGDDYAVQIVEFVLDGHDGPPTQVVEVIRFRGGQICEIRPFYFVPTPFIDAAARRAHHEQG
ncbi:nuclear transport factor 2 family protein [Umezawaea sp. Da 62-37]|uniref:nuclear transport factor 2 family protein n=1 Tax=Umezawaea sp. Da 62-37 TaxID=3075927 RepID=UPI0028F70F5B|nr:nuclear transport factor 2 family protein [Umezawaea sp. Da 62-37]WNV82963.1 nuclear transport factor 2 family protein [Umezawaea sp. Da 62-37]